MEANFQGIVNIVYIIVIVVLWVKTNKKHDKDSIIAELKNEVQRKADKENLERIESNQNNITKNYLDRFDEVNKNINNVDKKIAIVIERIDNIPCRKDYCPIEQ